MPPQNMPQMHHFIPRFILRTFATEDQPPAAPSKSQDERNRSRKARKPKRDFLVNKLDLDQATLTQRPVSTEYALPDMYRDPGFDANPNHLEKKLAKLEGQASIILQQARDAFSKKMTLELKRSEKDTLRKFLFMMKYRNAGFFDRYDHDRMDDYDADDQSAMMEYMDRKGFTKPRDVWFDNLRGLLDCNMDAEGVWMENIHAQIYPYDAKMFILYIQGSFMAFCEPESCDEEFVLTKNAYNIFEGPSSPTLDILSGNVTPRTYTEYHNFAPVSPRLIIVLQNNFLRPPASDEVPPWVRETWEAIGSEIRTRHAAGSILQDIPIHRSEASYITASDRNWKPNGDDIFGFRCFQLPTTHVSIINNLFLEEAYTTSSIVYHSATFFRTSLERYLQDKTPGMKSVVDHPLEKRQPYLMTLSKIVRDLGGTAKCHFVLNPLKYEIHMADEIHMAEHVALEVGIQLLQKEADGTTLLPWVYLLLKQGKLRHLGVRYKAES
ncbi:hypothetical protein PHISP_03158 [Aspergillus sp. HF37]|nr:hypothetical protein PHISP_03158 [Aspergillus sp. HF37]